MSYNFYPLTDLNRNSQALNGCEHHSANNSTIYDFMASNLGQIREKIFLKIIASTFFLLFPDEITTSFRRYGPLIVDWPHKAESKSYFPPKGYAFLLFQVSVDDVIAIIAVNICCVSEVFTQFSSTFPTLASFSTFNVYWEKKLIKNLKRRWKKIKWKLQIESNNLSVFE